MTPIVQPVATAPGGPPTVRVAVKTVPGSSRDAIAGALGDRLKVRVTAPPEDGRANKAVEALLARACGLSARDASVVSGHSHREKTVELRGVDAPTALRLLGLG